FRLVMNALVSTYNIWLRKSACRTDSKYFRCCDHGSNVAVSSRSAGEYRLLLSASGKYVLSIKNRSSAERKPARSIFLARRIGFRSPVPLMIGRERIDGSRKDFRTTEGMC